MTLRETAQSVGAMVFGLTLGFGALEAGVRLFADTGMQYELEMWKYALEAKRVSPVPEIGHEHVPDVDTILMGVRVTTNDIGLRDEPVPMPKPDNTLRILMLGDSITFGWGVPQDQTVTEHLQQALAISYPDRSVEVINAGVGNYNAAMSVAWYLEHGRDLDADLVVFNYFINDAEPRPSRQGGWLRERSAAFVYFAGKVDTALRLTEEKQDWRDYYRALYDTDAAGFEGAKQAFNQLAEATREDSVPVLFAVYPELRELTPYPFQDVTDAVTNLATGHGWPSIDLLHSVVDTPPEDLWVTVPDPHPNATATALFAAQLAPFVEAQLTSHGN